MSKTSREIGNIVFALACFIAAIMVGFAIVYYVGLSSLGANDTDGKRMSAARQDDAHAANKEQADVVTGRMFYARRYLPTNECTALFKGPQDEFLGMRTVDCSNISKEMLITTTMPKPEK